MRMTSLASISMSEACPRVPPSGWWIMMRAWGNARRLPGEPGGQQESSHGSRQAHTNRHHFRFDVLDRVIDGHASGDRATRRIDVQG
jgi:hypothetical protein